jgi:omega-amidase
MNNVLNVSIVQSRIHWLDIPANLDWYASRLEQLNARTDLIVLPEMFNTGFSMDAAQFAETMVGPTVQWMSEKSAKHQAAVVGSIMIQENGQFFNRLIWMFPDGRFEYYDKRHLFRMAGEHKTYSAGRSRLIIQYKGWKICPMVCYDLRFPVWSRNRLINNEFDFDCLVYIANWPEKRSHAWKSLLIARAIENQCYVVGVNRVGADGNQIQYSGDSGVFDFLGQKCSTTERFGDRVETVTLHKEQLREFRQNFPALLDADQFSINL